MWQGGWPCWGRHRCPAQHSHQECLPALHTQGEHSNQRHRPRLGLCSGEGAGESSTCWEPWSSPLHQGDSLILLSKELKKLSSLSSAKRVTTECYCICTANAIIELSIPQGHHSTESDAEISDIIFQRT